MIPQLGLLVAASIAAFTVRQINVKGSKPRRDYLVNPAENGEISIEQYQNEEEKEKLDYLYDGNKNEEEEEEEVKLISGEVNPSSGNTFDIGEDEFEELLSGQLGFPLLDETFDAEKTSKADCQRIYDEEMANNASELERLRDLVKESKEREVRMESELLEYYGMKEDESGIFELRRQLKIKTVEIDMLKVTVNSLQAERKKLLEDLELGTSARKELEVTRNKIKELQRQIQFEASQIKGQVLLLKQQVSGLQSKEEETYRRDSEVEKKLKDVKQLEVELAEVKRKNMGLQHEKRDLLVKLDAAESKAAALSNMEEIELVAKAREEVNELRHANEDLQKQIEGLQMNRFSEVEEVVYLRWVNACLRFELRNYQKPAGKMSAGELDKNLSPRSQEKAKLLLLEYAGSDLGQGDTDLDSNFSQPSSPGSQNFDNASIDSSTSKHSSLSRKPSLIQKLKRWGRSKDDSSTVSQRQRVSLETLILRNAGDSVAITSFGREEQEMEGSYDDTLDLPRIRTQGAI